VNVLSGTGKAESKANLKVCRDTGPQTHNDFLVIDWQVKYTIISKPTPNVIKCMVSPDSIKDLTMGIPHTIMDAFIFSAHTKG
jgi:hypothetical protein